jgi:hypothetical protein
MSDEEKCKLIREFEGIYPNDILKSDYPHDLNATMRAARRLPEGIIFTMTWGIELYLDDPCWIVEITNRNGELWVHESNADPAHAAFECISAYLANARVKEQVK